jgi:predicted phosphodiesterase
MMRYALISDIHANLPALEAVLGNISERNDVVATYHLGDLVGYGPSPNDTVELLHSRGIPGISGNYDSTVAAGYKHCGCKYEDKRQEDLSHLSYQWTLRHTNEEVKRFLGGLPFRIDIRPLGGHCASPTVTLLHGNQVLNTVYVHADRSDEFLEKVGRAVSARAGDVVCFGHTHIPWHRTVAGVHYVNTGSVGRPKDGDWRAGYALVDFADTLTGVEFVRVEYDIETTVEAIYRSELPNEFADYLRTGGRLAETQTGGAGGP